MCVCVGPGRRVAEVRVAAGLTDAVDGGVGDAGHGGVAGLVALGFYQTALGLDGQKASWDIRGRSERCFKRSEEIRDMLKRTRVSR